jgi:hypothetical protein
MKDEEFSLILDKGLAGKCFVSFRGVREGWTNKMWNKFGFPLSSSYLCVNFHKKTCSAKN